MPEYSYKSSVIRDFIPEMPPIATNGTNTTAQNIVPYDTPPLTIILTVTLLVFFLAGFFSVYFCRCFLDTLNNSRHLQRSPTGNNGPNDPANASAALPGLDPSIIESFPMFVYSSVKDLRKGKGYDLECAICLCEFEDDDSLRLLPSCCHVFHRDCIDLWLKSHKTCPVCRKKLDATPGTSPLKCPLLFRTTSRPPEHPDGANEAGSISITIGDDDDELGAINSRLKKVAQSDNNESEETLSRSHSTGHSIVKDRENRIEKYTLELPDDDFHFILRKGHHCTRSCTAIEEYSNSSNTSGAKKKCSCFGEVVTTSIHIDGKLDDVSLASDGYNDKSSNLKNTASNGKDGEFRGEASSVDCDGHVNSLHSRNSSASATSRNSVVVRFSDVNDSKV